MRKTVKFYFLSFYKRKNGENIKRRKKKFYSCWGESNEI